MRRRKLIRWIKQHKRELTLLGIGTGAVILIILGIRNKEALKAYWRTLVKTITKTNRTVNPVVKPPGDTVKAVEDTITTVEKAGEVIPFKVRGHVRILPRGCHASPEKIASAPFALKDGQTWVVDYMKGVGAA